MKSLLHKDQKRRKLYQKFEEKRYFLNYIINNLKIDKSLRTDAYNQLILFSRNSSKTRVRNRCTLTNRPRAVYKKFKISRLMFRELSLKGEIPGIKKITW